MNNQREFRIASPLGVAERRNLDPAALRKLAPERPLWTTSPERVPCDETSLYQATAPRVEIIASGRVVEVGEPFDIKVIGASAIGLTAIWWFGHNTGESQLDVAHWHDLSGEKHHEQVWKGITISQPGTYTFAANSRDILYGKEVGVAHQASEGAGLAICTVEARQDISYDAQVGHIDVRYGKSTAWRTWMESTAVRKRYEKVWDKSRHAPTTIKVAFAYGGTPIPYNPPWASEDAHMTVLEETARLWFPGLSFDFLFGADPKTTDVFVEAGGKGNTSYAGGLSWVSYLYLYWETIFGHEFGHILAVDHHYPGADIYTKIHLPPDEDKCVMARNSNQYCSGCRAAMYLDLDYDTSTSLSSITSGIINRYPPGY